MSSKTFLERVADIETANTAEEARLTTLELFKKTFSILLIDGAVPPHASATFVITKASAAALTLAAPTSGTDDGVILEFTSNTAFAHAITATGLLQSGAVTVNVITFPAFAGGSIRLIAYLGKWNILSNNLCVIT